MNIIEFLEERISDEEGRAQYAAEHFPTAADWWDFTQELLDAHGHTGPTRKGLRHADKHSPEFVLAECAAKRAIIAHLNSIDKRVDPEGHQDYVQKILFAMALPYVDDPASAPVWTVGE